MRERPVGLQEVQENMFFPPFIITEEQIDECVGVLRETVEEMQRRALAPAR